MNIDLPVRAPALIGLVAHETYPATTSSMPGTRRSSSSGPVGSNASVLLINTPECFLSEGLAEVGRRFVVPPETEVDLVAETLERAGLAGVSHAGPRAGGGRGRHRPGTTGAPGDVGRRGPHAPCRRAPSGGRGRLAPDGRTPAGRPAPAPEPNAKAAAPGPPAAAPAPAAQPAAGGGGGGGGRRGDPFSGKAGVTGSFATTSWSARQGGFTALLFAAARVADALKALLDGGADVNQLNAGDKTSPLLIATINGHFDLAMLLLEHGADPNLAASTASRRSMRR